VLAPKAPEPMMIAATLSMVRPSLVPVRVGCVDIVPQNGGRLFRILAKRRV